MTNTPAEGKHTMNAAPVPKAKLSSLSTQELIAQYELAISSHRGRYSNTAPRQRRIDLIVDLIDARADRDDPEAVAWLS